MRNEKEMEPLISLDHVTYRYPFTGRDAVTDISIDVKPGEAVLVTGVSGCGKTTLIRLINGLAPGYYGGKVTGSIHVAGIPNASRTLPEIAADCGTLFQDPENQFFALNVEDELAFAEEWRGTPREGIRRKIEDAVKRFGIGRVLSSSIHELSEGEKQKVGLSSITMTDPKALIFDEPTVGLDPKQIIEIRNLIRGLGKAHTVILSTHILQEVQAVCDKIVVIDKGKLVANDTTENLSHNLSADHKLTVQIEGPTKEVKSLLEQIPQMVEVHLNRTIDKTIGEYELNAQEGCDIRREVFKRMAARNYPILLMRSSELTLEEIFLKLTTGDFYGNIDNGGAAR